jgi:DNA-directed RNA polymerase subunit M/transcription elongation factor TFIIS
MPIIACPTCSNSLKVPEELLGKKVKCSACRAIFRAEAAPAAEEKRDNEERSRRRGPDPDSRIAEEDEDRPRRRRQREEEDDDEDDRPRRSRRPHRGGLILGLGISALALTLLAGVGMAIVGACALPMPVVGLALGIVSWVMGNGDLKQIRARRMDRAGEGQTQTGRIMGMVSVILNIVGLCLCGGLVVVGLVFGLAILGMGAAGAGGGGQPPPFGPPRRR